MSEYYSNESLIQVALITLVLGGGCAILTGRAIALTWRSIWTAVIAMVPMGLAVRFVHFGASVLLALRAARSAGVAAAARCAITPLSGLKKCP